VKRMVRDSGSLVLIALGLAMLFFVGPLFALQAQSAKLQEFIQDVPDTPVPLPAPEQPLPYSHSHKVHLALGLECQLCHTNPDRGRLMAFPDTATCMKCHASFGKNRPSIQKLSAYDKSKTAIPWVRVYTVLP